MLAQLDGVTGQWEQAIAAMGSQEGKVRDKDSAAGEERKKKAAASMDVSADSSVGWGGVCRVILRSACTALKHCEGG